MVTFDASDPGTSRGDWDEDPRLARVATLDLDAFRSVLVVAAHPDDETLGAGGLIAEAVARGLDVTVVVVTDGAAADADAASARASATALVRAREVAAAAVALGVSREPLLLGYADGAVREERASIGASLAVVLDDLGGAPLVVSTWVGDGHRDHRVLAEIAVDLTLSRSLTLWQYPIWMWHWGGPDDARVPWDAFGSLALGSSARRAKGAALARFPSQTVGRGDRPAMLQARFLEHFARPVELFVI